MSAGEAAPIVPARKRRGRPPGRENECTVYIKDTLKSLDCDPVRGLAMIAMDSEHPVKIRAYCYAELAKYIAPYYRDTAASQAVPVDAGHHTTNVYIGVDQRLAEYQAQQRKKQITLDNDPDA